VPDVGAGDPYDPNDLRNHQHIYTSTGIDNTDKPNWPSLHTNRKLPFGTVTYFSWLLQSARIFGKCGAVLCVDKCSSADYLIMECWDINESGTYTWNSCKCRHTQWYDSPTERVLWVLPENDCFQCLVSTVESVVNLMVGGAVNGGRHQEIPVQKPGDISKGSV